MSLANPIQIIVVGAGRGTRMENKTQVPKQFALLHGRMVAVWTLRALLSWQSRVRLLVVLPSEFLHYGEQLRGHFPHADITIIEGGETRFHSVQNAVRALVPQGVAMVHDMARCLLRRDLLARLYAGALAHGSAVPVVSCTESIRALRADGTNSGVDRASLRVVQTPQAFSAEALIKTFACDYNVQFTDEASVWESAGRAVHLVEGDVQNIKITYPQDWALAEFFLAQDKDFL